MLVNCPSPQGWPASSGRRRSIKETLASRRRGCKRGHEIFGPVTCVYGYDEIDQAIAAANSLPVAFQASIFTRDLDVALDAAERLDASAVMVNDHSAFRTDWMPFAGRRESGYGVGGIPFSMREMTQEKMRVFRYPA